MQEEFFYTPKKTSCKICGTPTNFISINYRVPICSGGCYSEFKKDLIKSKNSGESTMKINQNTIVLTKESSEFQDIENQLKRIAKENGIDNVSEITIKVSKDQSLIKFKKAEDGNTPSFNIEEDDASIEKFNTEIKTRRGKFKKAAEEIFINTHKLEQDMGEMDQEETNHYYLVIKSSAEYIVNSINNMLHEPIF